MSDDDDLQEDTSAPTAPTNDNPTNSPPRPARPSRKTKESAGKAWEMLKPGSKRRKPQVGSDDDEGDNIKRHKSATSSSQGTAQFAAAQYPAPDTEVDDDEGAVSDAVPLSSQRKPKEKNLMSSTNSQVGGAQCLPPKFAYTKMKQRSQSVDSGDASDGGAHHGTAGKGALHDSDYASGREGLSDEEEDELDPDDAEEDGDDENAEQEADEEEDEEEDERALARQFQTEFCKTECGLYPSSTAIRQSTAHAKAGATSQSQLRKERSPHNRDKSDAQKRKASSVDEHHQSQSPGDGPSTHKTKARTVSKHAVKDRSGPARAKPIQTHRKRQSEAAEWKDGGDSDHDAHTKSANTPNHDERKNSGVKGMKARPKKRKHGGSEDDALDTAHARLSGEGSDDESGIELVDPGPKLALGPQHRCVKIVAKRAINDVLIDVCLKNAFPEGPDKHNQFTHPTLIRVARDLEMHDIARRLKNDLTYSRYLGSIPAQRISTFRGKVKKHTDGVVASTYGLQPGDGVKVDWLDDKLTYIYPHDYKSRKVDRHLPYQLPIFVQVMRAAWFSRPTAYGFKIIDRFTSSSLEAPREKEIPAAMLGLAATAVYASIVDFSASTYKARDFTGNEFADVYARNIRALQKIKDNDVGKYHVLMHGLFRTLCGSHVSILSGSKYADDLDALDVAGMPSA
ncbi:hypothetical protein VTO73DRAFT_7256 [Trametes versicolor]